MFRLAIPLALLTLAFTSPLDACINDRDSREAMRREKEREEKTRMQGLPEIPQVLRGEFDRHPALYYEMRRDRIEAVLEDGSIQYDLYDDVAVAHDRLGNDDAALVWMQKKLAVLEATRIEPGQPGYENWHEHWYSYHANAGTFHAHRWFLKGADRSRMDDLNRGRELIAKGIEIKPDAHFGREQYQLMAMNWIAGSPTMTAGSTFIPNLLGFGPSELMKPNADLLKALKLPDAVVGLSGLIVLGAAWESIDITLALATALYHEGQHENAWAALLRCLELAKAGKKSLVSGAPSGDLLETALLNMLPMPGRASDIRLKFTKERAATDRWQAKRTELALGLLKSGMHPDTHPEFWTLAKVPLILDEPAPAETTAEDRTWLDAILMALATVSAAFAAITVLYVWRRSRTAPQAALRRHF